MWILGKDTFSCRLRPAVMLASPEDDGLSFKTSSAITIQLKPCWVKLLDSLGSLANPYEKFMVSADEIRNELAVNRMCSCNQESTMSCIWVRKVML